MTTKSFKRKEDGKEDDAVKEEKSMEPRGRYKLRKECGKHYIHDNPLLEIEGKPNKRIVFPGDVLLSPPRLVKHIQDKFMRLDSAVDDGEERIRMEEERSVAHIEEKDEGEFFVYTAEGIKLNDTPLDIKAAQALLDIELEDEEERKEDSPDVEKDNLNE